MPNNPSASPGLLAYSLQVACITQAVVAVPVALSLGSYAFEGLFNSYYINVYRFITFFFNAMMAAGIVFVIIVQLRIPLRAHKTLAAEAIKSSLATIMWLWLILDAAFGPMDGYSYYPDPPEARRRFRTIRAALMSIVLFIIFYSTLGIAMYANRRAETEPVAGHGAAQDEHSPLLADNLNV